MGKPWQPWRSVAARLLWHYYAVKVRRAVAPLPAAAGEAKPPA
jgi:DNA-3-methyladenine glycosylase II